MKRSAALLRYGSVLNPVVLSDAQVNALKAKMRTERHTDAETLRRKDRGGRDHLQGPSGLASSYVTSWDDGIGVYPKMLWRRIEDAGYGFLLPAEQPDFRKMLNGDPKRPFTPDLLRVTLAQLGLDFEVFLGLVPHPPDHLETLIAELETVVRIPITGEQTAEKIHDELDRSMRALTELFARMKAAMVADSEPAALGVAVVRHRLEELPALLEETVGRVRRIRAVG